jgi:hypothetical protein
MAAQHDATKIARAKFVRYRIGELTDACRRSGRRVSRKRECDGIGESADLRGEDVGRACRTVHED